MISSKNKKFIVAPDERQKRLDIFLAEKLQISRSQAQKLIENKEIWLDEKLAEKTGEKLSSVSFVFVKKITAKKEVKKEIKKEKINVEIPIIAETEDFLVVDKPSGILTHPTEANETDTLVSWLIKKFPEIKNVGEDKIRPGIVHRLDREASGLLVIAKTQKMFEHLKKQFKKREIEKIYSVLVYGQIKNDYDTIDFAIGRSKDGKMAARPIVEDVNLRTVKNIQEGKEAITEFWVKKRFGRFTLLEVKIHSGRTHQIRVHMLAYNHPVLGDKIYFQKKLIKERDKQERLFLHSQKLCFKNLKNEKVCFESELPDDLKNFLSNLK